MDTAKRLAKGVIPRRYRPRAKAFYYGALPASQRRRLVARQLRSQAGVCGGFGSPLYADLLERAADDVESAGPCWDVLAAERATALGSDDALPLRFMAGVHRLVLEGRAPALARFYPSVGGEPHGASCWTAFRETVAELGAELRGLIAQTVQTNEVGRCAVLAGGFLLVARETGLPLRLLEIGASAGLNLRWDHYRYEVDGLAWGNPDSPVRLGDAFESGRPPLEGTAEVVERRGCDLEPIDPCTNDGRLTLMSLVWADQTARFDLLEHALAVAREVPVTVDRADGSVWLEEQLRAPSPGAATVVFHSFVMQFLDDAARDRFRTSLEQAGARASSGAPLAWLRMEWGSGRAETRLTTWPGGTERLLAHSTPQGWKINWLAS